MMERAYIRRAVADFWEEETEPVAIRASREGREERIRYGVEAVRAFWNGSLETDLETAFETIGLSYDELGEVDRVVRGASLN